MRDRSLSGGLAASLIILSLITCISAARVYEYTFKNSFNTGSVAIKLDQYQVDEHGTKKKAETTSVVPGQHVSYMPSITNQRADAYVRLKIDVVMDKETESPVTSKHIFAITDGWIQKGDYFYRKEAMKSGETEIAFQGIEIPSNWVADIDTSLPAVDEGDTPAQASGFRISARADAIQAANFTPNYELDEPWGPVVIENAKENDPNTYGVAKPLVVTNEMTFSRTSGLEANTTDLFRGFQKYMAGDTYTDQLKIKNEASNAITVYFKAENKNTELRDRMGLKITLDGKELYNGDLTSRSLGRYRKLTKIGPNRTARFDYEVSLPDDSMNHYSVLADDVDWSFKVVEDSSPKTGENREFIFWLILFGISAGGMLSLIQKNKATKKGEDETDEGEK